MRHEDLDSDNPVQSLLHHSEDEDAARIGIHAQRRSLSRSLACGPCWPAITAIIVGLAPAILLLVLWPLHQHVVRRQPGTDPRREGGTGPDGVSTGTRTSVFSDFSTSTSTSTSTSSTTTPAILTPTQGWDDFELAHHGGLLALRSFRRTYVTALADGTLTLDGGELQRKTLFWVRNFTAMNGSLALLSCYNKFVCAQRRLPLRASCSSMAQETFFRVVRRTGDLVSLADFTGKMVSGRSLDSNSQRLTIRSTKTTEVAHQRFWVTPTSGGAVTLKCFHGTYLRALPDGHVSVMGDALDRWALFKEVKAQHAGHLHFKSRHGKFLFVGDKGEVEATSTELAPCSTFQRLQHQDGTVSFKTCYGSYLSIMMRPVFTFYLFRAIGEASFPMQSVNMANLPGVMWYLHNEVVARSPRKFGITRIARLRVQTVATKRLAEAGMNFGVRFAFDGGACTGAGPWTGAGSCEPYFQQYGHFVGCNNLGFYPFPMGSQGYPPHYPGGMWFSFPREGKCDGPPTGSDSCTYSVEWAGAVRVDDLVGIADYEAFLAAGHFEYLYGIDAGQGTTFWDGKFDDAKCQRRVEKARQLFKDKFPDEPSDLDLPPPRCDFNCYSFYGRGSLPEAPEGCNATLQDLKAAARRPAAAPPWITG